MEYRLIPNFEAYEVNRRGRVRRVASKYVMPLKGRTVRLWTGTSYVAFRPAELVAMAFAEPDAAPVETLTATTGTPEPEAVPTDPGELAWLRARVAELEAELAVYRVEL